MQLLREQGHCRGKGNIVMNMKLVKKWICQRSILLCVTIPKFLSLNMHLFITFRVHLSSTDLMVARIVTTLSILTPKATLWGKLC